MVITDHCSNQDMDDDYDIVKRNDSNTSPDSKKLKINIYNDKAPTIQQDLKNIYNYLKQILTIHFNIDVHLKYINDIPTIKTSSYWSALMPYKGYTVWSVCSKKTDANTLKMEFLRPIQFENFEEPDLKIIIAEPTPDCDEWSFDIYSFSNNFDLYYNKVFALTISY